VVHWPSAEDRVTHLREDFGKLQRAGITLNLDKVNRCDNLAFCWLLKRVKDLDRLARWISRLAPSSSGRALAHSFKALSYKPEARGFVSR
jgi:hypothetical protein